MSCWNWRVRGEHGFRCDVVFGGATINASLDEPRDAFDAAKRSMSFVEVPDCWHKSHRVRCMHGSDSKEHLLPKSKIRIATVQAAGEFSITHAV
jgi:hypothetical protein|tara:strand:+ start:896 stop:1177 length:282 start_codon:yes stop_codon:yes gene_type:complete